MRIKSYFLITENIETILKNYLWMSVKLFDELLYRLQLGILTFKKLLYCISEYKNTPEKRFCVA